MGFRFLHTITRGTALAMMFSVCSAWVMTETEARSWREDLRFMAEQMQEKHKNLYHSITAQDFSARIAALNARIPSLTRAQVIVEMARIAAAVGDGHTNIYQTRDAKIGFSHTTGDLHVFRI
jgi:hypothetical protein